MRLSLRAEGLKPSSTVAVMNTAAALKQRGVEVLSFAAGEPDFDTPEPIKRAAIAAINAGQTRYMPTAGDAATRTAIAQKLTRENGIEGVTADHVVVTAGGKHALYLIFQALLDPAHPSRFGGQAPEVLLPVPAWVSFGPMAELAGGRVVELPTTPESNYKVTPQQLCAAITPRSRVLVLNSPSNPCGTMYTPEELRALCAVVAEAAETTAPDLTVVTDEMYEKIVYGGSPHFSPGSVASVAERTITSNGLSKAFAMTGWRVGYCAGSGAGGKKVIDAICKLQGQMTTCLPAFIYPAIRAAFAECAADVERMRLAFASRAALISELAAGIPGVSAPRPTGAFYLFCDIAPHLGKVSTDGTRLATPADFAAALLREHRVALVPGEDFGGRGMQSVRISFACSEAQIREGMSRLGAFVSSLK